MSIERTYSSATNLYSTLFEAERRIQTLEPLEQVQELKWLPPVAELLKGLEKTKEEFSNKKQGAIPSCLTALVEVLGECEGLIKKIQTHHDMAIEVIALSKDVESAFQAREQGFRDRVYAESLQERATLMTKKPLCQGNLLAVQSLQANIQELFSQPILFQLNLPSSSVKSLILSDKRIQAEIKENLEVTSFVNENHNLIELHKSDSIENFDKVVEFYNKVNEYSLKKDMFSLAKNERAIKRILSAMEKAMEISISKQKDIEQASAQISIFSSFQGLSINSSQPAQGNDLAALEDLKVAIENATKNLNSANLTNKIIEEAFDKLSQEGRKKLLDKISSLLLEDKKIKGALSELYLELPFSLWTSSLDYKLKAVTAILNSPNSK